MFSLLPAKLCSLKLFSTSLGVIIALGLVASVPKQVIGQVEVPQSIQQSPELLEAERLNQQVVQLYQQGKYAEAIPLAEKALAIREKVLGKEHPDVALSLNNLAALYKSQGNYSKAEPMYVRSLAIREKVHGKEHPSVALSLNNLAALYYSQGNYSKAEPMYVRSLAIREKVHGKEHPSVATSLNNLAELYRVQRNYSKAEPMYVRSLAILEKVLGKEHPLVATSLNNLALLYESQGNYSKAEELYVRSRAIREKVHGKEHPDVALSLNNLAALYKSQGNYSKAEPMYVRSLAILEKVHGKEHPNVALSLNNLAGLYRDQGNYSKAEELYVRSLAIWEKVHGKEHPDVALSLNNLAELYRVQGNYSKAEPMYVRSLSIWEKVHGKEHPNVATNLNNLSTLYWGKGDINRATDFFTRGLAIEEKNLAGLIYAWSSEQQKQDYVKQVTGSTDAAISLALQQSNQNPTISKLAATTLLRRKGKVLDAMTDTVQTLRSQLANNPENQKLFDEWLGVRQQLATLVYRGVGEQKFEIYKQQIQQLEAEKEQLEKRISDKSAEFRKEITPVELADIQAQIPTDAAMVEIIQYEPLNPKAAKPNEKWGQPRYAAMVLRRTGEPKWVDLGDADSIDKSVLRFQNALGISPLKDAMGQERTPSRRDEIIADVRKTSRNLDRQVMEPLRPLLGDARHLLLSPDGQLNLISFEALQDEQNKYMVEKYAFSYLTTGRDLLRLNPTAQKLTNPVIFADINYERQEIVATANPKATSRGTDATENRRSNDFGFDLKFLALEATLAEGQAIKQLFPSANLVTGDKATEATIKQLQSPSILHLATHGFFLENNEIKDKEPVSPGLNNSPERQYFNLENPLLRSGLALAGFNDRQNKAKDSSSEDGVLTALEVAGLNLRGTKLVVLSACETGLGDVQNGDGVYGLRRALVMAGSQSQLLSLWKVNDVGTKDLMVKYYQKINAGKGRHAALREVQLEFLKHSTYKHPHYWASFIPAGNWTPMNHRSSL